MNDILFALRCGVSQSKMSVYVGLGMIAASSGAVEARAAEMCPSHVVLCVKMNNGRTGSEESLNLRLS